MTNSKYYRITIADSTYHYLSGSSARVVRQQFERAYRHLGAIVSVQVRV